MTHVPSAVRAATRISQPEETSKEMLAVVGRAQLPQLEVLMGVREMPLAAAVASRHRLSNAPPLAVELRFSLAEGESQHPDGELVGCAFKGSNNVSRVLWPSRSIGAGDVHRGARFRRDDPEADSVKPRDSYQRLFKEAVQQLSITLYGVQDDVVAHRFIIRAKRK